MRYNSATGSKSEPDSREAARAAARPRLVALDNRVDFVAAATETSDITHVAVELWALRTGRHTIPYSTDHAVPKHLCFDRQCRTLRFFDLSSAVTFDALSGAEVSRRELPLYPRPGPKSLTPDGRVCVQTSFDGGAVSLFAAARIRSPSTATARWSSSAWMAKSHPGTSNPARGRGLRRDCQATQSAAG